MSIEKTGREAAYSAEELDEAAVWTARLRAPHRSAKVERGFQRWLSESASHVAAFEAISDVWDFAGALKKRPRPELTRWERAGFRAGLLRSSVTVVCATALAVIGAILFVEARGTVTDIGEQRVMTLEDGSRISLNTASRVVVRYDAHERHVELKGGEAMFEVTKNPARPFVVVAQGRLIKALGTAFDVREENQTLAVTLVEGKVTVAPQASQHPRSQRPGETAGRTPGAIESQLDARSGEVFTLLPGQRLTLRGASDAHIDLPRLERIMAWRRGQVDLEDTPLAEAARELNRYSTLRLTVEGRQAAAIRVNGVFRAGDTEGFAAAVARSYGLTVEHRPGEIALTGIPVR